MKRPPIAITCECGESASIPYGERWICPKCKRSWNTMQIPDEEYAGLLRRVRRHQFEVLGMAALAIGVLAPLIAFGGTRFIGLVPIAMAGWLFFVLPAWRRRYRRTVREAPRWNLHPE